MPIILFYDSRNIFVEAHFFVLRFDRVAVQAVIAVVAVAVVALRPLPEPCPRLFNVGLVELPSAAFRFRFSWISSTDRGQPWFLSGFLSLPLAVLVSISQCFWWEFWCAGLHLECSHSPVFACRSVPHFMASTCNWFISPAVANRSAELPTANGSNSGNLPLSLLSRLSVRF